MTRKPLTNALFYGAITLVLVLGVLNYVKGGSGLVKGPDHVAIVPPQATSGAGGPIEVVEFFSYVCDHCYAFDPALKSWVAKLPPDVVFRRIPAVWVSGPTLPLAQLFYSLEAMGESERLHDEVFAAIHRDKVALGDEKTRLAWLAAHGVAPASFSAAWNSPAVQARVEQAAKTAAAYNMQSVPALAVAGRYVTSPELAAGYPEALTVADRLLARVRAEAGAAR